MPPIGLYVISLNGVTAYYTTSAHLHKLIYLYQRRAQRPWVIVDEEGCVVAYAEEESQ